MGKKVEDPKYRVKLKFLKTINWPPPQGEEVRIYWGKQGFAYGIAEEVEAIQVDPDKPGEIR